MKTLADIKAILGDETYADLLGHINDIKAAVRASDAGVIADLTAQLETLPAITAERDGLKASIANFLATDNETRAAILADAAKSEKQKALEAAQADLDAAKAKLEALSKP